MKNSKAIRRFAGRHSFLSNFHPSPIEYEGIRYPTAEHAFQAAKSRSALVKKLIASCASPRDAKKLGRKAELRDNWNFYRIEAMRQVLRAKFEAASDLASALDSTGDAELVEGNNWNDTFWGVCRGVGENNLGKLLMEIRERNRSAAS